MLPKEVPLPHITSITYVNRTSAPTTTIPVEWTAATFNSTTNKYEINITKPLQTLYLWCYKTANENELQFEISSQLGSGISSSSTQTNTYPFWISQQFKWINEYDYCIFTFFNDTTQLFQFSCTNKRVNNADVSQQVYFIIPATIAI